jgi:hypothetical protein
LTPLQAELEFLLNMKVVDPFLIFQTHIYASHLYQCSLSYGLFGETY